MGSKGAVLPRLKHLRAAILATAVVVFAATACTGSQDPAVTPSGSSSPTGQGSQGTETQSMQGAGPVQADIPAIIQNVAPSVVTVFTRDGLGSGVVYAANG